MKVKVVTTQFCPVFKATPKKAAGGSGSEGIAAGQEIEVEVTRGENGELLPVKGDLFLVVWPPNLYPDYMGRGHMAYVEPEHVKPLGELPPGNATLNGIMAQLVSITQDLAAIKAKLGI